MQDVFSRGELVAERFRILSPLGRGGGGQVYAAHDLLLDQDVALKTILPDLAGGSSDSFELLRSEVLAARAVTHPNVCRTFDLFRHEAPAAGGEDRDVAVMAMELLEGETLAARLRRRAPLPEEQAAEIARQLAEGLAAAHAAGVLHLDLKSSNVVLVAAGGGCRAVLTDFGLARSLARSGVTAFGGTPGYMAPEQAEPGRTTPATDVYSFGCVLHEMLTGRVPGDPGDGELDDAVPRAWRPLLESCLAPAPAGRPAGGAELSAELRRISIARRSGRRWERVAVVLLILALGGLMPSGRRDGSDPRSSFAPPGEVPSAATTEYRRGLHRLAVLEPAAARQALERAVANDPDHVPALLALSEAWSALGATARARSAAERAAEAAPESLDRRVRLWLEGRLLETRGQAAEAADRYRTLHALRPADLGTLERLARTQLASGQAGNAQLAIAPLLGEGARLPEEDQARLAVLEARVARDLGETERQLVAARRAARFAERAARTGIRATAKLLESSAQRTLARDDQGLAAAQAALDLFTRQGNPRGRLEALRELATIHVEVTGEPELAAREHSEALELARRLGDRPAEATLLVGVGSDAFQSGDLGRAVQRFRQARALYRELDDLEGLAITAGNLALVHLRRGELHQAEGEFESAVELHRRSGQTAALTILLNNLGILYSRRGERRRARATWGECAELADERGDRLMAAMAAINLSWLDLLEGDAAAAEARYERDLGPASDSLAAPAIAGEVAQVASSIALAQDREDAALAAAKEAIELLQRSGDLTRVAVARQRLAGIHLHYGRSRIAERMARQSTVTLATTGQGISVARSRYCLAHALIDLGLLDEAREVQAALTEGSPGDDVEHVLLSALAAGRLALALDEPVRAIEEIERGLAAVPPGFLVPLRFEADLVLATAQVETDRREESTRRLRRLLADAERGGFLYFARRADAALAEQASTADQRSR